MQNLYSFDLIEHVLRNYGSSVFGVAVTTPERVAWLKLNVAKLIVNWHGYGSSPSGNKAYLGLWNASSSLYDGTLNHTNGTVTKITQTSSNMSLRIDTNGFVHFIAYADASNGTTASTINTDFIELEVYMAAGSIPQADYTLTLNATATFQNTTYDVECLPSATYTFSILAGSGSTQITPYDSLGNALTSVKLLSDPSTTKTFTTPSNAVKLRMYMSNNTTIGTLAFTNPQLELGSSATAFAPMKTYDVTQAPGIVTQAGTPLNAANLNTLETGLQTAASTMDTHIALQTTVHGSTSAATASKLVHRDANGRAQFVDPSANQDAATKIYVDTHANLTNPHSATSANTASRLVLRDASARAQFADPSAAQDASTKAYTDATAEAARPYASGTYTGDASSSRDISLPFTPSAVILTSKLGQMYNDTDGGVRGGIALTGLPLMYGASSNSLVIGTNKFTLTYTGNSLVNVSGTVYYYIIFK
jgi:hypothetical protein